MNVLCAELLQPGLSDSLQHSKIFFVAIDCFYFKYEPDNIIIPVHPKGDDTMRTDSDKKYPRQPDSSY